MAQLNSTQMGSTNSAIWMDEPIAMPSARSILFFIATMTAVMCSTALPASGSKTMDRKLVVRPDDLAMSWMLSVMSLRDTVCLAHARCRARLRHHVVGTML